MARSSRRKSERGSATAAALLTVPVQYGTISFHKGTASGRVKVERRFLKLLAADRLLTNKRLSVLLTATPGSDNPEQGQLFEDERKVVAVVDVHSISATKKYISFGISCNINSIDRDDLSRFSDAAGKLVVYEATDIPRPEKPATPSPAEAGESDDESPE